MTEPTCPTLNGETRHLFALGRRSCLCGARTEITAFGDERRQFVEIDGTRTSEPFPQVDPYTGVILPSDPN